MKKNSMLLYSGTFLFITFSIIILFIASRFAPKNRVNETSVISSHAEDALCTEESSYKDLQRAFRTAENVCYLDLSFQNIKSIPSTIAVFKHLHHLNLNGNIIEHLPPEIGELKELVKLTVVDNPLKDLPPEIGGMTNLEMIDLSKTAITSLPAGIEKLSHIKYINIDETPFKYNGVPPVLKPLTENRTASAL